MKTELEIREIIQKEYERQRIDTNHNFISRFAKAVYGAISEHSPKEQPAKSADLEGEIYELLREIRNGETSLGDATSQILQLFSSQSIELPSDAVEFAEYVVLNKFTKEHLEELYNSFKLESK